MAWDYQYGMCMSCSWDQKTPPAIFGPFSRRGIGNVASHAHSEAGKKRGNQCSPFHRPPDSSTLPLLPDNIQAWAEREGPTANEIVTNSTVQEAFQGPPARAQIHVPAANRFFPDTNEQNPKDNKYDIGQPVPGWKPDCVPNQPPPPGTSKSFKDCLKQHEDI
ncbi:hypothetical protein H0H87_007155 [Tephrocybe sp. NHM501043]|nr:hypothetical protein H0H87_007155 [Tephrocybe sp. NHM501043]